MCLGLPSSLACHPRPQQEPSGVTIESVLQFVNGAVEAGRANRPLAFLVMVSPGILYGLRGLFVVQSNNTSTRRELKRITQITVAGAVAWAFLYGEPYFTALWRLVSGTATLF